jgi:hypothetical protein
VESRNCGPTSASSIRLATCALSDGITRDCTLFSSSLLFLLPIELLLHPPVVSDDEQLPLPDPNQRERQVHEEEKDQHNDENCRDYPISRRIHFNGEDKETCRQRSVGEDDRVPGLRLSVMVLRLYPMLVHTGVQRSCPSTALSIMAYIPSLRRTSGYDSDRYSKRWKHLPKNSHITPKPLKRRAIRTHAVSSDRAASAVMKVPLSYCMREFLVSHKGQSTLNDWHLLLRIDHMLSRLLQGFAVPPLIVPLVPRG